LFAIDSNGNLTQKTEGSDTWGYEWNARNELTRVTKNSVEQARFSYDPLGRRVEKVAGGITTAFSYDGDSILREVRGSAILKYVQGLGIDEPLAQEDGSGALTYFHTDTLGSVVRSTNPTGAVTLTRQYDAWGNIEGGANEPGYAFTGREWDPEVGLYYYRARYYDPKSGRFISTDPIGFRGGVNFYSYVRNRPVSLIDPLGLMDIQSCPGKPPGASLCCKGGQFAICTDMTWWSQQSDGVRQCFTEHEEYHVWQMQWDPKPKCGECTGEPCQTLDHPGGPGSWEGAQRECAAWLKMYGCLQKNAPQSRWFRVAWIRVGLCLDHPNFQGFSRY